MKLSIGENIKLLRKSKDITQEQLAEIMRDSRLCNKVVNFVRGTSEFENIISML